jgi:hypothetical protein
MVCDICEKDLSGKNWHCGGGCDYDLCLDCYEKESLKGPITVPLGEDLMKMDKQELVGVIETMLARGGYRDKVLEPPTLTRVTTGEHRDAFELFKGPWEDSNGSFAIRVDGVASNPKVFLDKTPARRAASVKVGEAQFVATRSDDGSVGGEITVPVSYPSIFLAQCGSAADSSTWSLKLTNVPGVLDFQCTVNGVTLSEQLRKPMKPARIREREPLMFMARMTEPCSKALGLFEGFSPFALDDSKGRPWCIPVLQTEAALRQSPEYIKKVGKFYDKGLVPPMDFEEELERRALKEHGYSDETWVQSYRFAARMLSKEQRSEFFFLRANDRLFVPKVELIGCALEGQILDGQMRSAQCSDIFAQQQRRLLIASTAS